MDRRRRDRAPEAPAASRSLRSASGRAGAHDPDAEDNLARAAAPLDRVPGGRGAGPPASAADASRRARRAGLRCLLGRSCRMTYGCPAAGSPRGRHDAVANRGPKAGDRGTRDRAARGRRSACREGCWEGPRDRSTRDAFCARSQAPLRRLPHDPPRVAGPGGDLAYRTGGPHGADTPAANRAHRADGRHAVPGPGGGLACQRNGPPGAVTPCGRSRARADGRHAVPGPGGGLACRRNGPPGADTPAADRACRAGGHHAVPGPGGGLACRRGDPHAADTRVANRACRAGARHAVPGPAGGLACRRDGPHAADIPAAGPARRRGRSSRGPRAC